VRAATLSANEHAAHTQLPDCDDIRGAGGRGRQGGSHCACVKLPAEMSATHDNHTHTTHACHTPAKRAQADGERGMNLRARVLVRRVSLHRHSVRCAATPVTCRAVAMRRSSLTRQHTRAESRRGGTVDDDCASGASTMVCV
jgi:hypothetical protein